MGDEAVLAAAFWARAKHGLLVRLHAIIDYFSAITGLETRKNRIHHIFSEREGLETNRVHFC